VEWKREREEVNPRTIRPDHCVAATQVSGVHNTPPTTSFSPPPLLTPPPIIHFFKCLDPLLKVLIDWLSIPTAGTLCRGNGNVRRVVNTCLPAIANRSLKLS